MTLPYLAQLILNSRFSTQNVSPLCHPVSPFKTLHILCTLGLCQRVTLFAKILCLFAANEPYSIVCKLHEITFPPFSCPIICKHHFFFLSLYPVVDAIESIKTDVIKDNEIRKAAENYVKAFTDVLPRDTILWQPVDSILWEKVSDAITNYAIILSSRYALDRYGKITEEDVREYMDIEQFIPQYDSIFNMRKNQSEENVRYLLLMADQTPNFDRECIYTVEFAHQLRYKEPHPAIPKLEGLMKSGKYSRYLHEVWRTWRCLKQLEISPSRDGMILNLKQIVMNPQDIKAINDFCFLATCDNIIRYCDYLFGNSAPLEQMMLFPEILMDDEENNQE